MRIRASVTCIVMGLVCGLGAWGQLRVDIGSTGAGDLRVPVAVPDFVAQPGLETVSKEMPEVL